MSTVYDYQTIFDEIRDELNRDDLTEAKINSFIRQAEKSLYRNLRIPPNLKRVSGSVVLPDWNPELSPGVPNPDYRPYDASGFAVPTDYLEAFLMTDGNGRQVTRISAQEFRTLPRQTADAPIYFTEETGQFYFWPSYVGDFFFMYYYEPEPLSITATENEVSHVIGEAILYAGIANGWRYIRDPEKHAYFQELAKTVFAEVTDQWKRQQMSGSTMQTRNPYA